VDGTQWEHRLVRLAVRRGLEDEVVALAEAEGIGTGAALREYPRGLLAGEPDEPQREAYVQLWIAAPVLARLPEWLAGLRTAWALEPVELRVLGVAAVDLSGDPEAVWQARWRPFRCAGFAVRATFHDPSRLPVKPGDVPLVLVAGSAFGTGGHATTRMALAGVRSIHAARAPRRWLDVGCGSGILAVAAARLGAAQVHGMDPDPHAAAQTLRMAELNGVGGRVAAWRGGLDSARGRYAAVVANLFADLLQDAAAELAARLEPAGLLYAGGIVEHGWERTRARLEAVGLRLCNVSARGRWRGALWERPAALREGNRS
jgi:ribosomal protein L11 methyltransferase